MILGDQGTNRYQFYHDNDSTRGRSTGLNGRREGTDWDKQEKALFVTKCTVLLVDAMQTQYIYEHDEYYEINPVIDNYFHGDKAWGYFVLSGAAVYLVADALPHKWRKAFLTGAIVLSLGVTSHNANIGIGLSF